MRKPDTRLHWRAILLALTGLVLTGSAAWAQGQLNGHDGTAASPAGRRSASLSMLDDPAADPAANFRKESWLRQFIDRNIFDKLQDTGSDVDYDLIVHKLAPSADHMDIFAFTDRLGRRMTVTEMKMRETLAKDEAYRIMSNMILSVDFVARLRDALEPYTRPLEVYEDGDGGLSPSYFGGGKRENAGQVFALNVGISSSHNLNVMANIYDNFQISLMDGTRLVARYVSQEDDYRIGLESNTRDELLVRLGGSF